MTNRRIHPCPSLQGEIQVPGDKSISHRAIMLSALSDGVSKLRGLLMGEDVLSTIACFMEMGVEIELLDQEVVVQGVGLHGLKAPTKVLDCGNSGTTLRLMMGILAGQSFVSRLTGDASLNRRPIERVAKPLRQMGAEIEELRASETERVVKISGRPLTAISYDMPIASAQVKSAVLLAGLFAKGTTCVRESVPSRDHSEIMLQAKGVELKKDGKEWVLTAPNKLQAMDLEIPGDISSAAFFLVAGLMGQGSRIRLRNVGINPTRTGIVEVLKDMGAQLSIEGTRQVGGEEVAELEVKSSALHATEFGGAMIPRLIDEIPVLAVAAAWAKGTTTVCDAGELRVKESDRIAAIERELRKLGAEVKSFPEGLSIPGPVSFKAGTFVSGGDHRIAMAMAVAATQAKSPSIVEDIACIQTSYPQFFAHLKLLGVSTEPA